VLRAQEMGLNATGGAQDAAGASALLGEIHWDAARPREAHAAFRAAAMALTQQGLRTAQAGSVMHWMARCQLQVGKLDEAKRDLHQAAAIMSAITSGAGAWCVHAGACDAA
jgi:hypothetical protein